ncbi:MAG: Ig-like domain-containing protein, partial [Acidimicrobiales bacterium]|nr:Ig-like domain-containing protein [Acidimicrobiales bacterium]
MLDAKSPRHHIGLATALALVATGVIALGAGSQPQPAVAEVVHLSGYRATVLGWTSWYGSYGLGPLGAGWCIDHGLLAPDAAHGYVPATVNDADPDTRAAMAWIVANGSNADRITSAAVMLALHDLMGATYPFGRLDVDRMSLANLGGFAGDEFWVLERARQLKAEGRARAPLRAPFRLDLQAPPTAPGGVGVVSVRLVDAAGAPVPGIAVHLSAGSAVLAPAEVVTGSDGAATAAFTAGPGRNTFDATTRLPDPDLRAFAPTRAVAQRIVQPGWLDVSGHTEFPYAPPTTTSTTTTRPPTTTTTSTT